MIMQKLWKRKSPKNVQNRKEMLKKTQTGQESWDGRERPRAAWLGLWAIRVNLAVLAPENCHFYNLIRSIAYISFEPVFHNEISITEISYLGCKLVLPKIRHQVSWQVLSCVYFTKQRPFNMLYHQLSQDCKATFAFPLQGFFQIRSQLQM